MMSPRADHDAARSAAAEELIEIVHQYLKK